MDEHKKIQEALTDYKNSMDILGVLRWGGYIATTVAVTTDLLGYTNFSSPMLQKLTTSGILLDVFTGILEKKYTPNANTYSYLASLSKLTKANISDINNKLYRNLEEFLND